MDTLGHNSVAHEQLRSVLDRLENLDTEKSEVAEQMKEVYAEAKGNGFDTKALRRLLALRKKDRTKAAEEAAILRLYASALGCDDLV